MKKRTKPLILRVDLGVVRINKFDNRKFRCVRVGEYINGAPAIWSVLFNEAASTSVILLASFLINLMAAMSYKITMEENRQIFTTAGDTMPTNTTVSFVCSSISFKFAVSSKCVCRMPVVLAGI